MLFKIKYIVILVLFLAGCSYSKCYQMGNEFNDLSICIVDDRTLQNKFNEYINKGYSRLPKGNDNLLVDGFYIPSENTIYCIKRVDSLLHELWHASGHLEEPYWEK